MSFICSNQQVEFPKISISGTSVINQVVNISTSLEVIFQCDWEISRLSPNWMIRVGPISREFAIPGIFNTLSWLEFAGFSSWRNNLDVFTNDNVGRGILRDIDNIILNGRQYFDYRISAFARGVGSNGQLDLCTVFFFLLRRHIKPVSISFCFPFIEWEGGLYGNEDGFSGTAELFGEICFFNSKGPVFQCFFVFASRGGENKT